MHSPHPGIILLEALDTELKRSHLRGKKKMNCQLCMKIRVHYLMTQHFYTVGDASRSGIDWEISGV